MFEALGEKIQTVFARLGGRGRLTDADIDDALRQVRVALLEADVNFTVVKGFIEDLRQKARETDIAASLTPSQTVIKLVHQALVHLLGAESPNFLQTGKVPRIVLLAGLQGSGKTSFAQKLAFHLKGSGHRPLLVAADLRRPAAVQQLKTLGASIGVEVFSGGGTDAVRVVTDGIAEGKRRGMDPIIVDSSGRTEVDEELLQELREIKKKAQPDRVILVADAMTGQAAVGIAQAFDKAIGIDGIVLTKVDGDARGGAALSMRAVTGKPIVFLASGEKAEALEPFRPERLASRILGMGDVLSLIERAEAAVDPKEALALSKKMRDADLSLEDFLNQLRAIRKMGSIQDILGMIPGFNKLKTKGVEVDEDGIKRIEAIVLSMTPDERTRPVVIDASRRRRIAKGSGTTVSDVNRVLRQFEEMKKVLRVTKGRRPAMPFGPSLPPGAFPGGRKGSPPGP